MICSFLVPTNSEMAVSLAKDVDVFKSLRNV